MLVLFVFLKSVWGSGIKLDREEFFIFFVNFVGVYIIVEVEELLICLLNVWVG